MATHFFTNQLYNSVLIFLRFYKFILRVFFNFFHSYLKAEIIKSLKGTDITINGKQEWDIQVHNAKIYTEIAIGGSLGICEGLINEWITCKRIDVMITQLISKEYYRDLSYLLVKFPVYLEYELFNMQNVEKSTEVAEKHYDLGNDLMEAILGPSMQYSCGYWQNANSLEEAQLAKMDLIARKLRLEPGMRVLDLGCGWGSLAKYLASKYKVKVVGITIGQEGAKYAREISEGLNVEIRVMDYRELNEEEQFDRICSVEMLEHIGFKNYRAFFEVINKCLKSDGLFLCQNSGTNTKNVPKCCPFISKHVLPNVRTPHCGEIIDACEDLFIIEDWHNLSKDFVKTIKYWKYNFLQRLPQLMNKFDERVLRVWKTYMEFSIGAFQTRKFQIWQIVFSKSSVTRGYVSVR